MLLWGQSTVGRGCLLKYLISPPQGHAPQFFVILHASWQSWLLPRLYKWTNGNFTEHVLWEVNGACISTKPRSIQLASSGMTGKVLLQAHAVSNKSTGGVCIHIYIFVKRFTLLQPYFGHPQLHSFCVHDTCSSSWKSLVEKLPSFVKLVSPFSNPINQHFCWGLSFLWSYTSAPH